MKKKEFVNMIVECVREVLNEDKCKCKDACSCKTNEIKVSACNDCGKPKCSICNPKGEKNPKKSGYVHPSKFNIALNNALKKTASPSEKKRIEKLIRMIQQKSRSSKINKIKESEQPLNRRITKALEKYDGANEQQVRAYVNSHYRSGRNLRDLELDAKSQKWNIDTTKAIYNILGNTKK